MKLPSTVLSGLLQLTLVCLIALTLPWLLWRDFETPEQVRVTEGGAVEFSLADEVARLKQNPPDWVLVGNSMLNTRIDPRTLGELSGVKVKKVAKGGSQSALWFLFIKKIIIGSGAKPCLVTVFFRDTDLTWPGLRLGGMNEELVDELQGPQQPEWSQVFFQQSADAGLPGWVRSQLVAYLPPVEVRHYMRQQIQNRSFRVTRIGVRTTSTQRRMELNQRFSLEHLRSDLGSDLGSDFGPAESRTVTAATNTETASDPGVYEDGPLVFDPSTQASFLPHLLALARDHGFGLHFHRVKRKPDADQVRRDLPAITAYIKDLRLYLEKQGCVFTDESDDPSLTLDMYVDGDHISSKPAMQQRYLDNFWRRVAPSIQPLLQAKAPQDHGLPKH